MKTLKILTAVCVIALAMAVIFGVLNYSESGGMNTQDLGDSREIYNKSNSSTSSEELLEKEKGNESNGYQIGDSAADFELINVDEKMVSLDHYPDAKGFIIVFTCNHCPYSKAYENRLIAIDKEFKTKGYPVIAINPNNPNKYPDDSFENMKIRSKQKGFTFPYLFDAKQELFPQYGATKTPHIYLINKQNDKNVVRYIGAIDDNYQNEKEVKNHFLRDALNALINGNEINPSTTAAIGCTIKI